MTLSAGFKSILGPFNEKFAKSIHEITVSLWGRPTPRANCEFNSFVTDYPIILLRRFLLFQKAQKSEIISAECYLVADILALR